MITPRHIPSVSPLLSDNSRQPCTGRNRVSALFILRARGRINRVAGLQIVGWSVRAVVDVSGENRITADEAVELRENGAPFLSSSDPVRAGAGLDGIYSAAREIGEAELFEVAQDRARRQLRGKSRFLRSAQRRAGQLGRKHLLTPFQVFDFMVAADTLGLGGAVADLGFRPSPGKKIQVSRFRRLRLPRREAPPYSRGPFGGRPRSRRCPCRRRGRRA